MAKIRIQPHSRLQEWVAEEEGFFRDEGLDYEFDAAGFIGGAGYAHAPGKTAAPPPPPRPPGALPGMEARRPVDASRARPWDVHHPPTPSPWAGAGAGAAAF